MKSSSGTIRVRRVLGCLLAWGALICLSASRGHAARDDEMLAQLRQQIRELEKTPAEAPGMFEKQRGERRLATLRQEVAVLEKRRLLESQERDLREVIATQPRALLREKLQAIAPDVSSTDTRLRELTTRRLQVTAEREAIARKLSDARRATTPGAAVEAAELEERMITKDEELRAIALRAEVVENEGDLVRLAQGLRGRLKAVEAAAARPSLRAMFAQQTQEQDDAKIASQLAARAANLEATLRNGEAGLELQRKKNRRVRRGDPAL